MKVGLDCLPCVMRQALEAARAATTDEALQRQVLYEVAQLIPRFPLDVSPPELGQRVYRLITQFTGNSDPYREKKRKANETALELYPRLKEVVNASEDRLLAACKFAIAGNSLDLGSQSEYPEPESLLDTALALPFAFDDYQQFRANLKSSSLILYLGDNAGEVAFDRVLVEEIRQMSQARIYFVVRQRPVINDATLEDARFVGLDKVARVIANGSDAPATILSQCSEELLRLYRSADLIISKGQGNFETLNEERRNIFFLLRVKCSVVAKFLGAEVGQAVLKRGGL